MLALQKTKGYIKLGLPPSLSADGERYFPMMTVTFDPVQISSDALAKIIADASGLKVTEVK